MFALPPLVALLVFILARPLDFIKDLREIPFLYIFVALTVFGLILDARLGYTRLRATPLMRWALGVMGLAVVSGVVMAPHAIADGVLVLAIVLTVFMLVSQSVQRFKALEAIAATVLLCSVWISAVCVHQGLQPLECVAVDQKDDHSAMGRPDGRSCAIEETCYLDPPEPQALYRCEHAGILGITSIAEGRVRYVGVLHDPNEVALTVSVALPLAVAFYQRRRNKRRLLFAALAALLAVVTVVMSKSRGGVLVLLAVLGVYFLKRYGWRGLFTGAAMSLPVLMLGGRSGAKADSSTTERLEIWHEGVEMVRAFPAFGVGHGQFTEHHHLTAHNSVLLAAAEAGLLAAVVWTGLVYVAIKVPLTVLREVHEPGGDVARTWALALLAAMAGMAVGTLFLTFNYHFVLWTYLGMSAALWACVRQHVPGFRVRFGLRDLGLVTATSGGLLVAVFITTRLMLG